MAKYVELLVRGDDRDIKPYLDGYLTAASSPRVVFADEAGFHILKLRERIRHHGEVTHVITAEGSAAVVRKALAAAAPRHHFEIRDQRTFEYAHFSFSFDTPSRDVASKLKARIGELAKQLTLTDYAPKEKTDPGASKTELYTPEHDYRFAGGGVFGGDVFAIVDARAALNAIDFTDCGEIIVDGI